MAKAQERTQKERAEMEGSQVEMEEVVGLGRSAVKPQRREMGEGLRVNRSNHRWQLGQ